MKNNQHLLPTIENTDAATFALCYSASWALNPEGRLEAQAEAECFLKMFESSDFRRVVTGTPFAKAETLQFLPLKLVNDALT